MYNQLTEAEKFAECLRICGPNVGIDMHRMAPEMCPIKLEQWHNPKSYRQAVTRIRAIPND